MIAEQRITAGKSAAPNVAFLDLLRSQSKPLSELIDALRSGRGTYSAHETIAAARPALLASIYSTVQAPMLVVVPTTDVAERAFADIMYYLGEAEPRNVALLRSRDEAIGAIESPSERSARMSLLNDLVNRERGRLAEQAA